MEETNRAKSCLKNASRLDQSKTTSLIDRAPPPGAPRERASEHHSSRAKIREEDPDRFAPPPIIEMSQMFPPVRLAVSPRKASVGYAWNPEAKGRVAGPS
jgi:hypothetical protein